MHVRRSSFSVCLFGSELLFCTTNCSEQYGQVHIPLSSNLIEGRSSLATAFSFCFVLMRRDRRGNGDSDGYSIATQIVSKDIELLFMFGEVMLIMETTIIQLLSNDCN